MKKEKIEYLIRYYLHLLSADEKSNLKYPYLNDYEKQLEKEKLATLISDNFSDKILWNNCPNCNKLARTPKAKQCRFCEYDWH